MGAGAGAKLEQARNEGALAKRRAEAGVGRADGAAEVVRVQEGVIRRFVRTITVRTKNVLRTTRW